MAQRCTSCHGAQQRAVLDPDDHLGRPEGLTDQNKQRVWRANLRAFDRRVITDTIGGFHLGFPGQYHDTETGHAYNIHRDYHPAIGRYLQSDPIGLQGGINTYAYANNNPVDTIDPLGLEGIGPWNNGQMGNVAGGADPCVAAALFDSLVNVTPIVGTAIALFEPNPQFLDYASPMASTAAFGIELGASVVNRQSGIRLGEIQSMGRNHREQIRLQNRISVNRDMAQIARLGARALGAAAIGVEARNFLNAAQECGCKK